MARSSSSACWIAPSTEDIDLPFGTKKRTSSQKGMKLNWNRPDDNNTQDIRIRMPGQKAGKLHRWSPRTALQVAGSQLEVIIGIAEPDRPNKQRTRLVSWWK